MPRGNPNIWKKHGASYAELSGTSTSIERAQDVAPRRLPPVSPASLAEARDTKPAGVPSLKPHKGVGSFVLQSNWSLGVPPCGTAAAVHSGRSSSSSSSSGRGGGGDSAGLGPSSAAAAAAAQPAPTSRWAAVSAAAGGGPLTAGLPPRTYNTETKSNFGPPPSDFRRTRSAGPGASQFPKPDQPNDWKTLKQVDFRPELATGAPPPPPPFKAPTSGSLLPSDVPPNSQFVTQHRTHFQGRSFREAQSLRPSGCSATQAAGYNIITGAGPYNNNAFEHWDGRDYRRHR